MIGIYSIRNKISGKVYIGSSNNIENRWKQHKRELANQKHCNKYLQNAWNKYGEDNFDFSVVEECDEDKLLYIEQFYIDKFKSAFEGYNIKDKTKDMMTELDYERRIKYMNYEEEFLKLVKNEYICFEDVKTKNRIKYSKYNQEEYLWYADISLFLRMLGKINFEYCYIRNVSFDKEEEKFITFNSDIDCEIRFNVICYKENDVFIEHNFKYNVIDRSIYYIGTTTLNKFDTYYDSDFSKEHLGKLYGFEKIDYDSDKKIYIYLEKFTNKYFKKFLSNINFLEVEDIYIRHFKEQPEFLEELYKYFKRNNKKMGRILLQTKIINLPKPID